MPWRKERRHSMTYPLAADRNGDGYIEPEDFQRITVETAARKLSDHLLSNLPALCNIFPGSKDKMKQKHARPPGKQNDRLGEEVTRCVLLVPPRHMSSKNAGSRWLHSQGRHWVSLPLHHPTQKIVEDSTLLHADIPYLPSPSHALSPHSFLSWYLDSH